LFLVLNCAALPPGLGPPYYFNLPPTDATGATKYDGMWAQLADPLGFKAAFGPTTTERWVTCRHCS